MYHPICPLCRRGLEGPQITKEVLEAIETKSGRKPQTRRSPSPPITTGRSFTGGFMSRSGTGDEAKDLLLSIGVQPPSDWVAFLKIYRRVTKFHRDNFPDIPFEVWVRSLDSRTIAEIIRKYILR
jgi:hypothetical protein